MTNIIIKSYRDAYFWEWILRDHDMKSIDRNNEAKRALRKFYNKPVSDRITVKDDGDTCIVRFPLPEDITSREDAVEYFKEYEYIYYRPTYYDCTGQLFTSWFKIYQAKDGRFWAYHSIGMDV